MEKYYLTKQTLAYVTAEDATNTQGEYLVAGSQNILIDRNRKVRSRPGYSKLGASSEELNAVRNGITWNTSIGSDLPIRFYSDEMEVWIGTLDRVEINAWTRVKNGLSETVIPRMADIFDGTENIDLLIFIQGNATLHEWSGAMAVVDSVTSVTITKKGTTTFGQNRFYATRNKTLICVRTGTEYTYTGGEGTVTLTGIADTTGLVAGDILIQKIVETASKPVAGRVNTTLFGFENQIVVGSESDSLVYISKNTDYKTFTYSTPRLPGEGAKLTLDAPSNGFGSIGSYLIMFSGRSGIHRANFTQTTVGTTIAETVNVKMIDAGVDQSAVNQETIVQMGNAILYLTHEPTLRLISDPEDIGGIKPTTYSNPIKPDFDAEDWTDACATFWRNTYYLSAPASSRLYMLEFVQDADGKTRRFWQPPQILPVRAFSNINEWIHGHSNSVPETYKLFDPTTLSDLNATEDKIPINAVVRYAYKDFGDRAIQKNFDEYMIEGEINPSTRELNTTLRYDYEGSTQEINKIIDGQDTDIMLGAIINASLGQNAIASQPLAGTMSVPVDANKFQIIFEIAKEDFTLLQAEFSTNEVDTYFAIISHGGNIKGSPRKNTFIKK